MYLSVLFSLWVQQSQTQTHTPPPHFCLSPGPFQTIAGISGDADTNLYVVDTAANDFSLWRTVDQNPTWVNAFGFPGMGVILHSTEESQYARVSFSLSVCHSHILFRASPLLWTRTMNSMHQPLLLLMDVLPPPSLSLIRATRGCLCGQVRSLSRLKQGSSS